MRNNKKGFTIVELVIVIAVIAILAAVLIPTFSSVTNSARASAAQQQAKAGLDSIIALTEGSLPDGTMFFVTNHTETGAIDYGFKYTGNKLTQVDLKKSEESAIEFFDGDPNVYAVYVTADAVNGADSKNTKTTAVRNILLNAIKTIPGYSNATGVAFSASQEVGGYYTLNITGTLETESHGLSLEGTTIKGKVFKVYYTTDIQETMVVFVGTDN